MRQLLLLRHAKSSWSTPGMDDFDRPLNDRGLMAAPIMGQALQQRGYLPDLILCSTARRACQTLDLVQPFLGNARIKKDAGLYLASPSKMLQKLHRDAGDAKSVMIVAHNPGLHMMALGLAGHGEKNALAQLAEKYPTCAAAVLEFEGDWSDLKQGSATLIAFLRPKDLVV